MNPLDAIMICKVAPGMLATKSHELVNGAWETTPFDAGYYVQARAARVDGLGRLFHLLHVLAKKPECFVLRGALAAGVDGQIPHVRRYHELEATADDPNPAPPSYVPTSRRWLCLDVDDYLIPDELRHAGARSHVVDAVVAGLPTWLQSAGVIVQWSSSAGLDGFQLAKMHLWFWLDRPVCDFSLREYFHAWNASYNEQDPRGQTRIDCALFNPVQPHYTAAPRFAPESSVDPLIRHASLKSLADELGGVALLSDRLVMRYDKPASPPPELLELGAWERKEAILRQEEKRRRESSLAARAALNTRWGSASKRVKYVNAALNNAVAAVEELHGAYEWYGALRKESYSTYQLVAAGELEEDVWRATWEEVGGRAGGIPGRKMTERDLKRLLDGAARRADARELSHVGGAVSDKQETIKPAGGFTSRAASWLK